MQFRRQPREAMQINLTPLIDVVFLLLIFFMVSTSFTRETQLQVDLPKAANGVETEQQQGIDIGINQTGQVSVAGRALQSLDLGLIKGALRQAAGNEAQPKF